MSTPVVGPEGAKTSGAARGVNRRRAVVTGSVVVGALLFYAAFLALVSPSDLESTDAAKPFGYRLSEDDDAPIGRAHLVQLEVWSNRGATPLVTLHHREGMDGPFQSLRMDRVGGGTVYAAELPPLPEGERVFYYVQIRDGSGATLHVPENAPDAPLLHVRWEGHVSLPVLALHITLMIGSVFFLFHALHFSALTLALKIPGANRSGPIAKVHKVARWGWLAFFVGGIPLGIYVSGTALGWHNAWGAWPLGTDITDTKTELLVVAWALPLVLRPDLWGVLARRGFKARASDRTIARLVVATALLTVVVYAIPHSIFFQ